MRAVCFTTAVAVPLIAALSGCTIDPVSGDRALALVSPQQEIAIGDAQFALAQQMQGGTYSLDPALSAYVSDVGGRLAAVSDRPLPYEFVVLDDSAAVAWDLPGGKVAVSRGLLEELHSEAELAAVLAHEIAHSAAHRNVRSQPDVPLQAVGGPGASDDYTDRAVGTATLGAQLITERNAPRIELDADRYAMLYLSRAGYEPRAAAVLLEQLWARSAANDAERQRLAPLLASHPLSSERVEKSRAVAAALPAGGEFGRARYESAIATLRQREPAYAEYDLARDALAANRTAEARRLAEHAAKAIPGEPLFLGLLGDVALSEQHYNDALQLFTEAIRLDDRSFYYHLHKGLAHRALRQWDLARKELETSTTLLPTADAYYALGTIAEQRGDRVTALREYASAAQSSSDSGKAAEIAGVRLDLPSNPSKYIDAEGKLDPSGQLILELGNPTRLPVTDVVVTIRYWDAEGSVKEVDRQFTNELPPGGKLRSATGLGPFTSADACEIGIVGARVRG